MTYKKNASNMVIVTVCVVSFVVTAVYCDC